MSLTQPLVTTITQVGAIGVDCRQPVEGSPETSRN